MKNYKISILIANYNNGHFFKDCYDSLINQTLQEFEVVVLDDCSSDDSFEVIQNIIKKDDRFKLFKNDTNRKVGFTKRKLVELANSEICGFLDPDDALKPKALEIMVGCHFKNIEAGLIYSNFIYCTENLEEVRIHNAKQIEGFGNPNFYNMKGEISHFATFKKSIYNKTSGINPYYKIAEDQDWYLKIVDIAPSFHINEALYLYRIHKGGISTNNNIDRAFFWHWVAIINAAERRGTDVDKLFYDYFVRINKLQHLEDKINSLKKSRLLKLLYKLGIFKAYKYL